LSALHAKRIHIEDVVDETLGRPVFDLSKTRRDAPLAVLTVSELGFEEEGVSLADVYARGRQPGLEFCSAEVGPQLRLEYLNQPLGEFLHIAMAPIARYGGEPTDFTVANGGGSFSLLATRIRTSSAGLTDQLPRTRWHPQHRPPSLIKEML
jgi:hypothetical protein